MIIFYNMTIRYFSSYHSMWFLLMFWCQYPLQCSSMCVYLLFPSSAFTPPTCVACFATSVRLARSLRAVVMFPAGEGFAGRWHIPEGRWWGDSGPLCSGFSKEDLSALLCHRNTFIVVVVVVGSTRAPWLSIPALSFFRSVVYVDFSILYLPKSVFVKPSHSLNLLATFSTLSKCV